MSVADALKHVIKAMEILTTLSAAAGGGEVPAKTMTPLEKHEMKLKEVTEKLELLNAKIAGGKSKIPDKDAENKTKFEETISTLESKIAAEKEKEAKKAEKAEKPKAVKAKAEKPAAEKANIPKMTPAIKLQLKAAFEPLEAEWDDKYYDEFKTEVNELSESEYAEYTLQGHISKFANKFTEADEAKPALMVGGGASRSSSRDVTGSPVVTSLAGLQEYFSNGALVQVSPGVFKVKKSGIFVTGPPEDTDEEFEDKECDDVTYIIGQTTKRVYKPSSDGPDEFVGYWGVGEW